MLAREGIEMNRKKLRRLYAEEKLQVRKRGGRERALGTRSPMTIPQGKNQRLIIASDTTPSKADPALVKSIAKAHRWWCELSSGAMPTVASIARREGVSDGHIGHHLPLAFLAPDIVQGIVTGNHPPDLTAEILIKRIDLPLDWAAQKTLLGFSL